MAIERVFRKVIVSPFYQQNTGFFLFVFFLMFGIVESSQLVSYHLSLMAGILNSYAFMGIAFALWTAYTVKCIAFVFRQLSLPQNSFLYVLAGRPLKKQFLHFVFSLLLLLLPVVAYATAAIVVGLNSGRPVPTLLVISFLVCLLVASTGLVLKAFNGRQERSWKLPVLFRGWKKPFSAFYLAYIFNELKLAFFVTKTFSYLVLIGFLQIESDNMTRVALLGLLFCLFAHAVLIFELRKWEDSYLLFVKNLPVPRAKHFAVQALVYFLILLPEFVLLAVNHLLWFDFPGVIAFCVTGLLVMHCQLYVIGMNMEAHIQRITLLFIFAFALVLFHIYWIVPAVGLPIAYGWYFRNYYMFETMRL